MDQDEEIPNILTFPLDKEQVTIQMKAILKSTPQNPLGAEDIRAAWSRYLELVVQPVGWVAVWIPTPRTTTSASASQNWKMKKHDVIVEVLDIMCTSLEAEVRILKRPSGVENIQEIIEVPVDELYPVKNGVNDDLDLLNTAVCLDLVRFFFNNIWKPWDDHSECLDWPGTYLSARIKLHFDLQEGAGNQSIAARLDTLAWQAEVTQTELYGLEEDLGLDDDSDKSVDAGNVGKLLELHMRREEIRREAALLEDPVMREAAEVAKQRARKDARQGTGPGLLIVWPGGSLDDLSELVAEAGRVATAAGSRCSGCDVFCYPDLQHALDSSNRGDTILVSGKQSHQVRGLGSVGTGGSILGYGKNKDRVRIEPMFMSVETEEENEDLIIKHVDFFIPGSQETGIVLCRGSLNMENVNIQGGMNALQIVGKSRATLIDCTISESDRGVELKDGTSLALRDSRITKCQVGLLKHASADVTLSSSTVSECCRYGMVFLGSEQEKHVTGAEEVEHEAVGLGVAINFCEFSGNKYADLALKQDLATKMANSTLNDLSNPRPSFSTPVRGKDDDDDTSSDLSYSSAAATYEQLILAECL